MFDFTSTPFPVTADPTHLYPHPDFEAARATALRAIDESRGLVVVTGEVGCGKTTLLNHVATVRPRSLAIRHGWLRPGELSRIVARHVGLPEEADAFRIEAVLRARAAQPQRGSDTAGAPLTILIDEAQHLEPPVFEELRLLLNLEFEGGKLVTIVLFGQPELARMLAAPEEAALRSRVSGTAHIGPLDAAQVRDYIAFRIRAAGAGTAAQTAPRFTDEAADRIHAHARGAARIVHVIADEALALADQDGTSLVGLDLVEEAIGPFTFLDGRNDAATRNGPADRARARRDRAMRSPSGADREIPATPPPPTRTVADREPIREAPVEPGLAIPAATSEESATAPTPIEEDAMPAPTAAIHDASRAPAPRKERRSRGRRIVAAAGIIAVVAAGVTASAYLWARHNHKVAFTPPDSGAENARPEGPLVPSPPTAAEVPSPNVSPVAESAPLEAAAGPGPIAGLIAILDRPVPDGADAMSPAEAARAAGLLAVHAELPPRAVERLGMPALLDGAAPGARPHLVARPAAGRWELSSPDPAGSRFSPPDTFLALTYFIPTRPWLERPLGPRRRGDDVRRLQELLKRAGYLEGTPNGWFGEGTERAMSRLRAELDFPPSRELDPLAYLALESLARR